MVSLPELTLADVEQALQYVSPDLPREDWVRVGMALKSEFGDGALDVWHVWSGQSDRYQRSAAQSTWKSIKAGGGIGIGTLLSMAKQAGWKPSQKELSESDRQRLKADYERRKQEREQREAQQRERDDALSDAVARATQALLAELATHEPAPSEYLTAKQVRAHGVYVAERALVVIVDERDLSARVIVDGDEQQRFWCSGVAKFEEVSVRHIKRGCVVMPLWCAERGGWVSFQLIQPNGVKLFPRHGRKRGCFFLIGVEQHKAPAVLCVAEGYSTAASIYQATGYPVAVAVDAGNLAPVCQVLRQWWPEVRLVICADNDVDNDENPGLRYAAAAAESCGAVLAVPELDIKEAVNG